MLLLGTPACRLYASAVVGTNRAPPRALRVAGVGRGVGCRGYAGRHGGLQPGAAFRRDTARRAHAPDESRRGRRPTAPAHAGVAARRARGRSHGRVGLGVGHPLGSARHGQDHARAGDRPLVGPQVRRALGRLGRGARRAPGDGGGAGQPRPLRTLHGPLPRRDPPLHEGPAGRTAAGRRERVGHPRRGHHREPLVLRHLPAPLTFAPAHARAPHRRRPRRPGRPRGGRPARPRRSGRPRARGARRDHPARLGRRPACAHRARGGVGRRLAGRGCRRRRRRA